MAATPSAIVFPIVIVPASNNSDPLFAWRPIRPIMTAMVLRRVLLLVVAAAGAGCGSSTSPPNIDTTPPIDTVIRPSPGPNGCFDGSNHAGIVGCWYAYDDWYGGTPAVAMGGDCPAAGFTEGQCSAITTPIPGQVFTNVSGAMCTSGTAAKVIMDAAGATATAAIWGAGIGFDMNNGGTADGGTGQMLPWDATAHGVTGFSFHIDSPPVGGKMRIEFPTSAAMGTTDVTPAYWGGADMNLSPFTAGGTYSFHWEDVGGPEGIASPMPFDKTKILSMRFHVVTNTSSTIPFSYCITDVRALY